jgi:hypothetical protein
MTSKLDFTLIENQIKLCFFIFCHDFSTWNESIEMQVLNLAPNGTAI